MGKYDDIINLPHHISKKHPRLSMEQRAAQFAPFSALTGYEDEIKHIEDEQLFDDQNLKDENSVTTHNYI